MNGPTRDERLGAALRGLDVPEHGPGFWERMQAALEDEAPARQPLPPSPPAPRRSQLRLGVAVAAVVAAIAAAVIGLPGGESPERALADQLEARVQQAIASLRDVRASGVAREGDGPPIRFSFALTADGDVLLRVRGGTAIAYDSGRGIERQSIGSQGRDVLRVERRGVAPGPPDLTATELPAQQQLGAGIRALLAADDPRVTETSWRGRDAWRAVVSVKHGDSVGDVDQLVLVVDRETGLPVRVRGSRAGATVYDTRVDTLEVNTGIPRRAFARSFPRSADVAINREPFDRVTLAEARARIDSGALVPSWVPKGYTLTEVAVAERDRFTGPAPESGKSNPRGLDVISLGYRRGFDQLTITTRRASGRPEDWTDPFRAPDGPNDAELLTLANGALAGARAELVVSSQVLPHLWSLHDGLVITVGGTLSRSELLRVAESLKAA